MDSWLAVLKEVGNILGFTNAYGITGGSGGQQKCSNPTYILKDGQCYPPVVKGQPSGTFPSWLPYAIIGVGALTLAVVVKKIMK